MIISFFHFPSAAEVVTPADLQEKESWSHESVSGASFFHPN
jgi:hypothetical protein